MLRAIGLTLFVLGAVSVSVGQEAERPGAEHQRLQVFVGAWDATMDMGGQKMAGRSTYKSICGGMWVESDFAGDLGGMPFQGHGLDGYDLQKKKYVAVWVDSMSSAPMTLVGDYDEQSKTMTMTGAMREPDGRVNQVKTKTELKDKDHFLFTMLVVQPDGTEQPMFTINYVRRP
jgi:hypothetical protein